MRLSADTTAAARAAALAHPRCPAAALAAAAASSDPHTVEAALTHPRCPREALIESAAGRNGEPLARAALAHQNCPAEALTAAAATYEHDPFVAAVLEHRNCPAEAVARAATSNSLLASTIAFSHPHCPSAAFESPAARPGHQRLGLASNPALPAAAAATLAEDPNPMVRARLANNRSCLRSCWRVWPLTHTARLLPPPLRARCAPSRPA